MTDKKINILAADKFMSIFGFKRIAVKCGNVIYPKKLEKENNHDQ